MVLTHAILFGLLTFGLGNPFGDMPAYLDAMESAAERESAEAQVAEAISRHAQGFKAARGLAKGPAGGGSAPTVTQIRIQGDRASAVLSHPDRTEFVQLVRSNHKWLVVPPERARDF
jgi:hypothetical protein